MAGQPRKRAMILDLERRTREYFEDSEHTTLDYVAAWVENGQTLVQLAAEMAESVLELKDLDAGQVSRYLYRTYGDVIVKPRLELARTLGAHAIVERRQLAMAEVTDKDDVPAAKLQNDMALWLAGKWNRAELGEQKPGTNVNVQLSVAQLHIDAMRQRTVVEARVVEALPAETPESEAE